MAVRKGSLPYMFIVICVVDNGYKVRQFAACVHCYGVRSLRCRDIQVPVQKMITRARRRQAVRRSRVIWDVVLDSRPGLCTFEG
jgi:hypothetical protein